MNKERKTNQLMVHGVKYRIMPAGPGCPSFNCEGCAGQHNMSLCLDMPDCQKPRECAYVQCRLAGSVWGTIVREDA